MILTKLNIDSVNLDSEITEKIDTGRLNELLLIVPTNRKIRALKRELISSTQNKTSEKLNLENIGTISARLLFNEENVKERILSESASTVLLSQSFRENKLVYFNHYGKDIPHGTLERIKNVIGEYKRQGITVEQLQNEAESLIESERLKALDIAAIYKTYQEKLNHLNVNEIGDIYFQLNRKSTDEFLRNFRNQFSSVELIIIHGFDEFTSPEIEIINKLAGISNVRLFLSFDYYKKNEPVFSHLNKCYKSLKNKGFKDIIDRSETAQSRFHTVIKERLFNSLNKKSEDEFRNSITRIKADDKEKEIELIAKEIKYLIKNKNVQPDKICIAFNLIHNYSPVIRDIFPVYGIPFNLTDRIILDTAPPVTMLINFLEILENDFYYKNIFRALSQGALRFDDINLSGLLKASVDLKIISGYENWKQRLNEAILSAGDEDDETGSSKRDIPVYEKALEDVKYIHNLIAPFNGKLTIDEFYNLLIELIYKLNLPGRILNSKGENIESQIKSLTVFRDTVGEIFELLKAESGAEEKFGITFYLDNIRTAVSSSRYNIKEKAGYGVQVTTVNEIRGLVFDYLFISGLVDGDFPTRYSPEIFFSGSFKRSEFLHQVEERYRFYQALCSWNKGLYFTFSMHEERKELSESNFLKEFTSIFTTSNKNKIDYNDFIYSKEELYQYIGKQIHGKLKEQARLENVNVNKIKEAVEVDKVRMSDPFAETPFTGYVGKGLDDNSEKILKSIKEKEFSITQLENYAKCPYKYFAERVLQLKALKEPTEEIEALEMGSLLHNILFDFYRQLKEKRIVLKDTTDSEFKDAEDLIFKIAEEKIDKAGFSAPVTFYEREKILGIGGDRKKSVLYKFLLAEKMETGSFIPEFFEIEFGENSGNHSEEGKLSGMKAGDVKVHGKIDRIDISRQENQYKVIDYKLSGAKPTQSDLLEGISLQLPLYMLAARELIKAQLSADYSPADSEIYSLKLKEEDFGRKPVRSKRISVKSEDPEKEKIEANEQLISICVETIQKYVSEISSGKFNLTTLNNRESKICGYCSFRSICRIEEVN